MKTFIFSKYQKILTSTLVTATTIIFTTHAASAQLLRGAGDSFAQPLIERYSQEYTVATGNKFKYTAVGSGGGIRLFMNNSVDFAATNLIPTPIEINQMEDGLLMLPVGGGSLAIVYHLKEVSSNVQLSRQFTYQLTDQLVLGGWTSYFLAQAEGSPTISVINGFKGANADIWSWAITTSLTDLGKLGSQLSFVFGMPPKVTNNDIVQRSDQDTSLHLELSYRYPLTERISITPGFLMITNPEHNAANSPIWIGLIRTSLSF